MAASSRHRRWIGAGAALSIASALLFGSQLATAQQAGGFSPAGRMLIARSSFPAFALNNTVLVGGDFQSELLTEVDSTPLNVPAPDNFRRSARGVTLKDGRVLVVGGRGGVIDATTTALPVRLLDSTMLFEPSTRLWSAGPRLSQARTALSVTLLADGKVLVAGGSLENQYCNRRV
jgi:hypothetical protein